MSITIKSKKEIGLMASGGRILADIVRELAGRAEKGVSTEEIDKFAKVLLKKYKVRPAFLGYYGYPAVTCLGVNDMAVHGIPTKGIVLKDGDLLSIDMGIIYEDLFLDHAITVGVGKISDNDQKLLNITQQALTAAINQAVAGKRIGDISNAIQTVAELAGFSVVRQMTGHGVGYAVHEEPEIPCFGTKGTGPLLKEGMVLALEPMVVQGGYEIKTMDDGWTTRTLDGSKFAIFEHTIAVGSKSAEILTK